ncbi:tetronasin ABC transporter integral membrane protein [Marinithermofilum abyssi]|uniref:Tetronasin ABC transporter integral membrane protein n=1 Tax=Marinithermofilum abyssi TaxID=1571185 RepID=A0A8J2YEI5_9BACL|nr:ABC transporter permease [Marinithermofilum abyssi]GGE24307.1 tetronasin ABC transporter integral membrane protein [Marinithermofilum abyssi]
MSKQLYAHTERLSRFIIRRDRIRIPIWLFSLTIASVATALALANLYPNQEERQAIAKTMINPATTAIVGPGYGLDHYTLGAMMAHQMLGITAFVVGIMSILLVVRHTRADEEHGRIEIIRSLPTGRLSHLTATILVVCGVNVLLAFMHGFGLYLLNIESMDLEGSLLYGAALGATGLFFTAIGAFFAQLSDSSRGTIGLSFAVLGLAYLIRAVGDVSNQTLSWFSPFGWVQGTEVYVNNYWWPIFLTVGIAFVFIILALYLNVRRDLESGFLPSKPGRKHASSFLLSPLGLNLRLQRTGLLAWSIGLFVFGATYGSVLGDTESFFEEVEIMQELLRPKEGVSLTEQFLTLLMTIISMVCTIPALMAMFKLKGEEKNNRTEHVLARAVSRTHLMSSYFIISLVSGFVMLSIAALGMGIAATTAMDNGIALSMFMKAAWVYLPAICVMIGIAVFLIGVAPKLTGLTWLYLVYSYVVVYLGGLFQFPDWMAKLSPYGHIPKWPIEDMAFTPVAMLTMIALVLIGSGYIGYNKRDIAG